MEPTQFCKKIKIKKTFLLPLGRLLCQARFCDRHNITSKVYSKASPMLPGQIDPLKKTAATTLVFFNSHLKTHVG